MPPRRKTDKPRAYGRQDQGRTIKSFSTRTDLAAWAEAQAKAKGMSFSEFIEHLISTKMEGFSLNEEPTSEQPALPAPKPTRYKRG